MRVLAGESQTNNLESFEGEIRTCVWGAIFVLTAKSAEFKSFAAESHDSLRATSIQREMGAADNEEVPVVSTELYHKDFDAFVKVRSPRFPPTLPTLLSMGVPSFFVSASEMPRP